MSAILNVYFALTRTELGVVTPYGNMTSPINGGVTTGTTNPAFRVQRYNIAAAGDSNNPTYVWDWADRPGIFDALVLQIIGDGYLSIAVKHDEPTSSTDRTPTATAETWQHHDLANHAPFIVNSDTGLTHDLPDTHAKDDGDGFPALWSDAGVITGIVTRVVVWNRSDDVVVLELVVIN